jgi:hypothetical protein
LETGEVFDMNCQEFWNTMPEPNGHDHPHLAECGACASRLARQRELAAGLRAMAADYRRISAPARVESRLLAVFRSQTGATRALPARKPWMPILSWATAFAMLIAFAVLLVVQRRPEPVQPPRRVELASLAGTADAQPADYDGFIPLPNAQRLTDNEEVNLVRVELPRSAMIALGLEVNPERAAEMVQADVMVGADGLARAVRFLDSESLD